MSAPKPDCQQCGGTGSILAVVEPPHPPHYRRCECALRLDILENVEKGLRGLTTAPPVPSTPLSEKLNSNLWIVSGGEFLAHLRHVAIRNPISWSFRVYSDAELVTSWLASIALKGQDIFDADAHTVSTEFLTLTDMVTPPDLLIIRMGIKAARNAAAPEVLQEALQLRMHEGKPTWIWDEPQNPLGPGHLFWSDSLSRVLRRLEKITRLEIPNAPSATPRKRGTFSTAGGGGTTPTRRSLRKTEEIDLNDPSGSEVPLAEVIPTEVEESNPVAEVEDFLRRVEKNRSSEKPEKSRKSLRNG